MSARALGAAAVLVGAIVAARVGWRSITGAGGGPAVSGDLGRAGPSGAASPPQAPEPTDLDDQSDPMAEMLLNCGDLEKLGTKYRVEECQQSPESRAEDPDVGYFELHGDFGNRGRASAGEYFERFVRANASAFEVLPSEELLDWGPSSRQALIQRSLNGIRLTGAYFRGSFSDDGTLTMVSGPRINITPEVIAASQRAARSATRGAAMTPGVCDTEARACALRYAKAELSSADIRRYLEEGAAACFSKDPQELMGQGACLPLQLGTDVRNHKTLELSYTCSDVCPSNGQVFIDYVGVEEEQCCNVGGYPFYDPGWPAYLGCRPPEVELPRFIWPASDGTMKQAVWSPCEPSEVTVVDDRPEPGH